MPDIKKYSAAEIAAMNLPGLPTTKAKILARAEKEGWPFETRLGLGGTRKVFTLPAHYMDPDGATAGAKPLIAPGLEQYVQPAGKVASGQVAGTVVAGSAQGDLDRIQLVVRAVTEWEAERGVKISDERRPAVIAVLYDYLKKAEEAGEGSAGLDRFLAALG